MENIMLFDVLSCYVMFMCSDSLWTVSHCRQWEGSRRGVEGTWKEPHFLLWKQQHFPTIHTGGLSLQIKRNFDWKSCMSRPRLQYFSGLCQHSIVLSSIRDFLKLPVIWQEENFWSFVELLLVFFKIKFNKNKNLYFTQVLITMTGAASKINTSFL